MSEAILVALITAAAAVIGQWLISRKNADELYNKLDKQSELADQKIRGEIDVIKTEILTLKDEVKKHNNVIERTYKLERDSAIHGEQITVNNREIKEIKEKMRGNDHDRG